MAQISAAIGRLLIQAHEIGQAGKGVSTLAAEPVAGAHIQKDQWTDAVLLQLTTPKGRAYSFALSVAGAREIADRLKIEAAKPTQVGLA